MSKYFNKIAQVAAVTTVAEKGPSAARTFFKTLGYGVLGSVAAVGVIRAVEGIIAYLKERNLNVKSAEYFKKMMEAHPQLQNYDPVQVARYWESLYHFAPFMAQDPLAAGAYITQSLQKLSSSEFGGPPPDTIANLVGIQKDYVTGRPTPMRDLGNLEKGLVSGAMSAGLETYKNTIDTPSVLEQSRSTRDDIMAMARIEESKLPDPPKSEYLAALKSLSKN